MEKENKNNKSNFGGSRPGAGRPRQIDCEHFELAHQLDKNSKELYQKLNCKEPLDFLKALLSDGIIRYSLARASEVNEIKRKMLELDLKELEELGMINNRKVSCVEGKKKELEEQLNSLPSVTKKCARSITELSSFLRMAQESITRIQQKIPTKRQFSWMRFIEEEDYWINLNQERRLLE